MKKEVILLPDDISKLRYVNVAEIEARSREGQTYDEFKNRFIEKVKKYPLIPIGKNS